MTFKPATMRFDAAEAELRRRLREACFHFYGIEVAAGPTLVVLIPLTAETAGLPTELGGHPVRYDVLANPHKYAQDKHLTAIWTRDRLIGLVEDAWGEKSGVFVGIDGNARDGYQLVVQLPHGHEAAGIPTEYYGHPVHITDLGQPQA